MSRGREMTGSNRLVVVVLPLIAAVAAVWFLAISPKRQEASDLETEVRGLQAQVDQQEQLAAGAEAARREFPSAYRRVVVLGKAAPEDDDTASLLVQLNRVASDAGVTFLSLETDDTGESAAAAPAPVEPPADAAEGSEQPVENADEAAPATSTPTEATAALLPIGASIGPAGLPVMKYNLSFEGDFFDLADFLAGLDALVKTRADGSVGVRGRLITVDSFELTSGSGAGGAPEATSTGPSDNPGLSATFTITTFLTPAEEGVTAGASPTGPAPATGPQPAATPTAPEPTATASTSTP